MAKIMLVEDDNNLREIYEARLLAEGYEIISAKDGEEALALATKEKPDLIISDVMMPKISGFDMLDILRSTPGIQDTKVVMMTALSQAEDKDRADKLGADRYLVKSQVTLEDVAQVADELLNGNASQPAGSTNTTSTQPVANPAENNPDQKVTETPVVEPPAESNTATPSQEEPSDNNQSNNPTPPLEPTTTSLPAEPNNPATQTATSPVVPDSAQPTQPSSNDPTNSAQAAATTPQLDDNAQTATAPTTKTEDADLTSAQPTPPPAPIATMPQVSIDDSPSDTQTQEADSQTEPTTEPAVNTPKSDVLPIGSPGEDAQTTAEEEAAIDLKIDDFVKNQLHSNESAEEPAQPATKQPQELTEEDQLNQGAGISLPSAEPTQNIAVKAPPQDNSSVQESTQPPVAPAQAPSSPEVPTPPTAANDTNAPTQATPSQQQDESTPSAATGGQRVIQPINDVSQKPDINQLVQDEADKNQPDINLPVSSVISPNGETVTPPGPDQKPDDHNPGNIIQPGGNPSAENQDTDHPDNIAL